LEKEFSERMDVFVNGFEQYLPNAYEQNIVIFEKILGEELKQETGMFSEGWWLWPIGRYVEKHGVENLKVSLAFIKELTKSLLENMQLGLYWLINLKKQLRKLLNGVKIKMFM